MAEYGNVDFPFFAEVKDRFLQFLFCLTLRQEAGSEDRANGRS